MATTTCLICKKEMFIADDCVNKPDPICSEECWNVHEESFVAQRPGVDEFGYYY